MGPGEESGSWSVEETDYGAPEPRGPEALTVEYEGSTREVEWQIAGGNLQIRIGGRGCDVPFRSGGEDPAVTARAIALELIRSDKAAARRRSR